MKILIAAAIVFAICAFTASVKELCRYYLNYKK